LREMILPTGRATFDDDFDEVLTLLEELLAEATFS